MQQMQVVIIARYENEAHLRKFCHDSKWQTATQFVLVNGGCKALNYLREEQILFACGDFDHFSITTLKTTKLQLYYKTEQKQTDIQFAIKILRKRYKIASHLFLYADGPRDDMFLEIIAMINHGAAISLYHNNNIIYSISGHYALPPTANCFVSLLNFGNIETQISIENAKYSIQKTKLAPSEGFISNETLGNKKMKITVEQGRILLMLCKKK